MMARVAEAEDDPDKWPEFRSQLPKIEPFRVGNDDPRVPLRGEWGVRAAQHIRKDTLIFPYQVTESVIKLQSTLLASQFGIFILPCQTTVAHNRLEPSTVTHGRAT
jgi:hypothetical protein